MSGVRRFLSRRERSPHNNATDTKQDTQPDASPPAHFRDIFVSTENRKPDKEEEKKIIGIVERLRHHGISNLTEANVEYALRVKSVNGDAEAAFRLLMLLEDTYEGIVKPYQPSAKLLGAVNRDAVTCYLDALLFAMFVRLDSFEAMLYDNFEDPKRKRLAALIRLWVNLLRAGQLVTTDITEQIQRALADCGWPDAAKLRQQDASEAFTFITGQLELPMLTLKMDMFHTGKEDPTDDHKFVNERLLEVAIIDAPIDGKHEITLEDCLEHYFNNRIEVKRHLENQRQNTWNSEPQDEPTKVDEKQSATHIEVVEVAQTPVGTSTLSTPTSEVPVQSKPSVVDILRPGLRKRGNSIFNQRKLELVGIDPQQLPPKNISAEPEPRLRKMSTRTEVLMPAWQFFKLLPWYTDNMPTSDAQVAAHFSRKRPVLGICLKRYSYTNTGEARRTATYVDIPLEIAVPDFVSDDHLHEDGPLVGNFRLMLQSVVCHRGVSVNSGHYICLSRGSPASCPSNETFTDRQSNDSNEETEDPWMQFDDLAKERVVPVDIHEALRRETPYLLFYQVQPIGDDGHSIHQLPTYAQAISRSQSIVTPLEKDDPPLFEHTLDQVKSEPAPRHRPFLDTSVADFVDGSERTSLETNPSSHEGPRGRAAPDPQGERRKSIAIDTSSISGSTTESVGTRSIPSTPSEDKSKNLLSMVSKIQSLSGAGSKAGQSRENSRSRPHSRDDSKRFTISMAKLTQRVTNNKTDASSTAAEKAASAFPTTAEPSNPSRSGSSAGPNGGRHGEPNKLAIPSALPSRNASSQSVASSSKPSRLHKDRGGGKRKHEDRDCVVM